MNFQKKIPRVLHFCLISFLFSWTVFFTMAFSGIPFNSSFAGILLVLYMFGPLIAAWFVSSITHGESFKESVGLSFKPNRWFFVSWLIMLFASLLTIAVSSLFKGVFISLSMEGFFAKYGDLLQGGKIEEMRIMMEEHKMMFFLFALLQMLFAGATINAVAALGEEAGWRGFLFKEFREKRFFDANIRIGLLWGAWHAPLIAVGHNYPEHPIPGIFMMMAWCVLLSFIFGYLRIKSKSVVASAILHGTLNASAGLSLLYIVGGNDLTVGMTGLAGFASLFIIIGVIFVYDFFVTGEKILFSKMSDHL